MHVSYKLIYESQDEERKHFCHREALLKMISLDLVSTKLCCFRTRVHCYYCFYIIFSENPVRRSEELRSDQKFRDVENQKKKSTVKDLEKV